MKRVNFTQERLFPDEYNMFNNYFLYTVIGPDILDRLSVAIDHFLESSNCKEILVIGELVLMDSPPRKLVSVKLQHKYKKPWP